MESSGGLGKFELSCCSENLDSQIVTSMDYESVDSLERRLHSCTEDSLWNFNHLSEFGSVLKTYARDLHSRTSRVSLVDNHIHVDDTSPEEVSSLVSDCDRLGVGLATVCNHNSLKGSRAARLEVRSCGEVLIPFDAAEVSFFENGKAYHLKLFLDPSFVSENDGLMESLSELRSSGPYDLHSLISLLDEVALPDGSSLPYRISVPHPGVFYPYDLDEQMSTIESWARDGHVHAVEVNHPHMDVAESVRWKEFISRMSVDYGLVISSDGGSDAHARSHEESLGSPDIVSFDYSDLYDSFGSYFSAPHVASMERFLDAGDFALAGKEFFASGNVYPTDSSLCERADLVASFVARSDEVLDHCAFQFSHTSFAHLSSRDSAECLKALFVSSSYWSYGNSIGHVSLLDSYAIADEVIRDRISDTSFMMSVLPDALSSGEFCSQYADGLGACIVASGSADVFSVYVDALVSSGQGDVLNAYILDLSLSPDFRSALSRSSPLDQSMVVRSFDELGDSREISDTSIHDVLYSLYESSFLGEEFVSFDLAISSLADCYDSSSGFLNEVILQEIEHAHCVDAREYISSLYDLHYRLFSKDDPNFALDVYATQWAFFDRVDERYEFFQECLSRGVFSNPETTVSCLNTFVRLSHDDAAVELLNSFDDVSSFQLDADCVYFLAGSFDGDVDDLHERLSDIDFGGSYIRSFAFAQCCATLGDHKSAFVTYASVLQGGDSHILRARKGMRDAVESGDVPEEVLFDVLRSVGVACDKKHFILSLESLDPVYRNKFYSSLHDYIEHGSNDSMQCFLRDFVACEYLDLTPYSGTSQESFNESDSLTFLYEVFRFVGNKKYLRSFSELV